MTPDEHRREAAETREGMGSERFARVWLEASAPSFAGDERLESQIARLDRHFMAPSTAADWINVESETDVTGVLPSLRCPTLLLDFEQSSTGAAESRHVQSRIQDAELALIPGDPYGLPFGNRAAIGDAARDFVGRERGPAAADTVQGRPKCSSPARSRISPRAAGSRSRTPVRTS